jgi:hypothetical protein
MEHKPGYEVLHIACLIIIYGSITEYEKVKDFDNKLLYTEAIIDGIYDLLRQIPS